MIVQDVGKIDLEYYYQCVPIFNKKNLYYIREEKEGNYSFLTNMEFLSETIMNSTAHEMVELCNGKRSIKNIEEIICTEYVGVDYKQISEDLKQTLSNFSSINLINWKNGRNPFMIINQTILSNGDVITVAREDEIRDLINYVNENFKSGGDYIFYLNPLCGVQEYQESLSIRYKLFSFYEDFFFLKDAQNTIKGIFSIAVPNNEILTVGSVGIVHLPRDEARECFDVIRKIIKDISTRNITKVRASIPFSNDVKSELIDQFQIMGFENKSIFEKEYGDVGVVVMDCIVA